jgi:hypothetical protein
MNQGVSRAADPPVTAVGRSNGPIGDALAAVAVATTAAFAGGGLVAQTVVVPQWRSMDPRAFLDHFGTYGPALGATLFPLEVISTLALAGTTFLAVRNRSVARAWWAVATACMVGTLVLLPIYFAGANVGMLSEGFSVENVPGELAAWNAWNWARTGLGLMAAVLCCFAIQRRPAQLLDSRILQRTNAV